MTDVLSLRRLNRSTLARQGLLRRFSGAPGPAIGRLAGLQAQHANQPYIALWSRLAGFERAHLIEALERKEVVRATVMRSTLHLVHAPDFATYDTAVAGTRMAVWRSTARKAGVDLAALHAALLGFCTKPGTIEEMERHLDTVLPDGALAPHVPDGVRHARFRMASAGGGLVHVPPSGFWGEHRSNRYVAATTWLGDRAADRGTVDEALDRAIRRYLAAYGPASAGDIGKWLGQARVGALKAALERLRDDLRPYRGDDGRELVDLRDGTLPAADVEASPRFLSRWDSVLISYDVRDRILGPEHRAAVIKKNGDFLPTFLLDGMVAGLWSVDRTKDTATIRLEPFRRLAPADRRPLEAEADRLVRWIEPDAASCDVVLVPS